MKTLRFVTTGCWVVALEATRALAGEEITPTGADLFRRHFEAVGERSAAEQVAALQVRGTAEERTQPFGFELLVQWPGCLRLTASNAHGVTVIQGRDAEAHAWRSFPEGLKTLDDKESLELLDLALSFLPPAQRDLAQRVAEVPAEAVTLGERPVFALAPPAGSSAFPKLGFDRESGLLVQVGAVRLEDYRPAVGLKLPFILRPDPAVVLRVAEIQSIPRVEASRFARPTGTNAAAPSPAAPGLQTKISDPGRLDIVRRPMPLNFGRGVLTNVPPWDPKSPRHAQVDLRGYDLRTADLAERRVDLLHADFDSVTRWPERLPQGFDPARVMELGRDPGLGVRQLHARGIRGQGVAIGIIDQPLLVDHVEYAGRLKLYEEIHSPAGSPAAMHGPAVASIAAGRTVGVAPAADLYYIAEMHGTVDPGKGFEWDFQWLAQSIERLLEVNATLPKERRMRVISISVGWSSGQKGYAETMAAVEHAKHEGVFIVSTALEETHHFAFHGLGREALADPNAAEAYGPGSWWAPMYWSGAQRFQPGERLLVPMDCRGVASPTGPEDYVYYWSAGWSWSVPWIAGLYALACQVQPELTPELFWAEALRTGRTVKLRHEGRELDFGTIADPAALLERLQSKPR